MAKAIDGRIYAQLCAGKINWIFTKADLPEWAEGTDEFQIQTVDITDLDPQPQVGWIFEGNVFYEPEAPLTTVPQEVTRFQARAALYQAGLLEQVESIVTQPETDMMMKLAWQDALSFKRNSQFVLEMAKTLNMTDEQLDNLFITAGSIE